MGVSVRASRNVRVGLPFWVAIPVWLVMLAVWLVVVLAAGAAWLAGVAVRAATRSARRGAAAAPPR